MSKPLESVGYVEYLNIDAIMRKVKSSWIGG